MLPNLMEITQDPHAMMSDREEAFLALVGRVFESVEKPELWPDTIYAAGEFLGVRRLFEGLEHRAPDRQLRLPSNSTARCQPAFFFSRADLQALNQYEQEFGELISRFVGIIFLSILRSQGSANSRETIGLRMVQSHMLEVRKEPPASISLQGTRQKLIAAFWEEGHVFRRDDLRYIQLLCEHLDRALRLQLRLNSADLLADAASGALDYLTLGVVFVDRFGRTLQLNRRAHEIISRSNVLRLSGARLTGRRGADTRSLRELIEVAVSQAARRILVIDQGAEMRPLVLMSFPLRQGAAACSQESVSAVVFVSDPNQNEEPNIEGLRQAFKLTHCEAQMAVAIAKGHGLQAAAEETGVALTTARTHLQRAFSKTGTRHQAELGALIHRTLTTVRHD
jgi:DNA-binding CsgD family transcriptional regulator